MGTKNNPAPFDYYANALPDEPMFILLGRDKSAPALVRLWALLRQRGGEDKAKVDEAVACADAMWEYGRQQGKEVTEAEQTLIEQMYVAVTTGMGMHPDGYSHSCNCDTCLSYD